MRRLLPPPPVWLLWLLLLLLLVLAAEEAADEELVRVGVVVELGSILPGGWGNFTTRLVSVGLNVESDSATIVVSGVLLVGGRSDEGDNGAACGPEVDDDDVSEVGEVGVKAYAAADCCTVMLGMWLM